MMTTASKDTAPAPALSSSAAAAISTHDLRVTRGNNTVLRGITLEVPAGRVTGLLGPSGSGKSTLMRAIVGVQDHVSGTITVLGEPAGTADLRRRIGYATQSPSVYGDLTVHENLAFWARLAGAPRERIAEVLAIVDMSSMSGRIVGTLSGGETSRVSIAVALLPEPELLVLDEPTVGLDPVLRRDLWNTFHGLAASGISLLVSSHVMDEADRCDELVLMRDGRVLAHTTPAGLRELTGKSLMEEAFLALVEQGETEVAS